MDDNKQLVTLESKIKKLFAAKTPKSAIKSRPGAGGLNFPYVDFGYVLSQLDKNFGIYWEFIVTDKGITEKYVWITGNLTIKSPSGFSISRPGTGGSRVKINKTTGEPVDLSNDIKAATTLAIRKAASLYGIGADVSYKEISLYEESPDVQEVQQDGDDWAKKQLMSKFFAVAAERGFEGEAAKKLIKDAYLAAHMADLTKQQLEKAIVALETKYQVVKTGEKPLKINELRKVEPIDDSDDPNPVTDVEIVNEEELPATL